MYLVHSIIKTCVFCVIVFIISGISSAQENQTTESENSLFRNNIVELLGNIPKYSKNLNIGPLRLYPSFEISEAFDDNVFDAADPDGVTGDFYTTYKPAISLVLPIKKKKHFLELNYSSEIHEYTRDYSRTNQVTNQEQDHVNQYFGGSVNLNFHKGFSVHLSNQTSMIRVPSSFTRRTNPQVQFLGEPPEEGEEPEVLEQFGFNTFSPRRDLTYNVASIVINLPDFFDKLDFDIHYSNRDISYKGRKFNASERNEDLFGGALIIKPLPKIRITTGFDYGIIKYDSAFRNDSTVQRIPFNISWQPTDKSNFFLDTSYNTRDYGRRSIFENFHGYDATLGYRFNVAERDELTIKFERSLKEEQFQTDPLISSLGDNNPYFFTQLNVDYVHKFHRNISFIFSPAFQTLRFLEKDIDLMSGVIKREKVDLIRVKVTARYDTRREWLFGEISYSYQDRDSNFEDGDLVKNVGQISVGINF
ncbi:MAG: hypothetical protein ACE5KZ_07385 [Candidatus Scalinduaceae bacterium]